MGKNFKITKNKDSVFKNSYTATFNIPIDKENKKDTKLIIYSSDLSKTHTTKDIHKRSDTAVISLSYKDKNNQSFCYLRKTSLRDITDNIINVISDNEYPFKTNEDITLKAIYKQEEKDERGNENKKYKEVVWGYKVIKTVDYNEASKSNPKVVIPIKDKKGKEIRFKISDIIKKDDLEKLKQGGHTIVFFAYLEGERDKFKYQSVYGKNHIRIDIKIPLYIKFKDDKLIIYEFEHAIKEKSFKASLNHDDVLVNKSGYSYIDKDISTQDINIYKDDKLSKELKTDEKINKNYRIYVDEANSANNQNPSNTNQTGQININQDTKYGINLLSKDNMDKFINSFNESKSLTRVDKGMWVDGDRGVGVLPTTIPILSDSGSRKQSIIDDTPAIFNIEGYEKNKSDKIPYYQRHSLEEVTENSNLIDKIVPINAFTNNINHNRLIKAIIYLESTHGWYDDYPIVNYINKSFRPMNVNYNYWIDLINQFHYTKDQVKYDKNINIEIGYEITKRIIKRIENPTIEKIGTIYNSLGKEKISNYGVLLKNIMMRKVG